MGALQVAFAVDAGEVFAVVELAAHPQRGELARVELNFAQIVQVAVVELLGRGERGGGGVELDEGLENGVLLKNDDFFQWRKDRENQE